MKRLILICGANGIGKSTTSKALLRVLPHSAYVESDSCRMTNPDDFRPALVQMQYRNLLALIGNALACPEVSNVIFPYGFHGHRKALFEKLWEEITRGFPDTRLIPLLLCCSPAAALNTIRELSLMPQLPTLYLLHREVALVCSASSRA